MTQRSPTAEYASPVAKAQHAFDGRYAIISPLGSSLTGRTYLARQLELDRLVVIKFMYEPRRARSSRPLERFQREARALARLDHPHVARLLDYGETEDGRRYMVTEHVDGRSLSALRDRFGWLPQERVVALVDQLASALAGAHDRGLVHRNLKPQSIVVAESRDGRDHAYLTDFGLVKERELVEGDGDPRSATGGAGGWYGTPRYLSPEQAFGRPSDARSDVYTLGLLAYELLAGRPPFDAHNAVTCAYMHAVVEAPPLEAQPDGTPIAPHLRRLVARCLAKAPEDRFTSMHALRAALGAGEPARVGGRAFSKEWATLVEQPARPLRRRARARSLTVPGARAVSTPRPEPATDVDADPRAWPPQIRPFGLNRWDLALVILVAFAAALLGALLGR
ncbi:MAG: serine/threonine protein kinase [Deltaproteobacteria bacterium]|nr:MAG: serine/threonine protein kinase [Deltaproteobacteria bacterium]